MSRDRLLGALEILERREPASCEIDEAFDVEWLWYDAIAETTDFGASAQPSRQPVIAYVFEAAPVTTIRSACFSQNAAAETWRRPRRESGRTSRRR